MPREVGEKLNPQETNPKLMEMIKPGKKNQEEFSPTRKLLPILVNHTSMQQHQQPKCTWRLESLHQPFRTIHSWTFFSWDHFQILDSEQYINSCSYRQAPTSLLISLHASLMICMRTTHAPLRERDYLLRAFNDPIAWAISCCHKKFRNFRHNQNQYLSAEI